MAIGTTSHSALPADGRLPVARSRLALWSWVLGALAIGAIAFGIWPRTSPPPMPLQANDGPAPVLAIGRLVPRSRVVTIAPPFGGGDARIAQLFVIDGETVPEGALLATLDSAPSLAAALAAAEAQRAHREAALAQTKVAVAASLAEAEAALARAEASLPVLRRDLERAEALAAGGATPLQTLDQRRLAHAQALQDAARARASLARYAGPPHKQPDILLAVRSLDAATAERDRAVADMARANIRAPSAGTVLTLHARPGERPGNSGLMTFAHLDDMIAEIEVHEDNVARLRDGAPVTLVSRALEAPLSGTLTHFGREVQRQTLTDPSPAAATDARVVRAVVALEGEAARQAARLVNLQVTARIGP